MKTRPNYCIVLFKREFTSGLLCGLTLNDSIRHVDRWHAAQWLKGIRRNSRLGRLEYRVAQVKAR